MQNGARLDREKAVLQDLLLVAYDTPQSGPSQRQSDMTVSRRDCRLKKFVCVTSLKVVVEDVNDQEPVFSKTSYECAVAENTAVGFSFCPLSAADPDEGPSGQVYVFVLTA